MTIEDGEKKGGLSLFAKHAVQFYIVGASGVLVNLGILYILTDIAVSYTHLTLPTICSV